MATMSGLGEAKVKTLYKDNVLRTRKNNETRKYVMRINNNTVTTDSIRPATLSSFKGRMSPTVFRQKVLNLAVNPTVDGVTRAALIAEDATHGVTEDWINTNIKGKGKANPYYYDENGTAVTDHGAVDEVGRALRWVYVQKIVAAAHANGDAAALAGLGGGKATRYVRSAADTGAQVPLVVPGAVAYQAPPQLGKAPVMGPGHGVTKAGTSGTVYLNVVTNTSPPADLDDPNNYYDWVKDPGTGKRLTRMHLIRGRFGGLSKAYNMMLGTALSNNFHNDSHFAQVESYVQGAIDNGNGLTGGATPWHVKYVVTPNYGLGPALPGGVRNAINAKHGADGAAKAAATTWWADALPLNYDATWGIYYGGAGVERKREKSQAGLQTRIGW